MTRRASLCAACARALHRAAVRLTPREVRSAYGAEMTATFASLADDAAGRGCLPVLRLLGHELRDLATARRANRVSPAPFLEASQPMQGVGHRLPQLAAWRQAGRSLVRRPGFAAAAVMTLAFGTATTTTIFSLVDTIFIKPLPYPDADRLVTVYEASSSKRENTSLIAPARLEDWSRMARAFAGLAGSYAENVTDTSGLEPERLEGRRVTPRYFDVFGVRPVAGRTFTADEERFGGPGAVVISDRFWLRRYARDRSAVGRTLVIGGVPHQVAGVMPPTFTATAIDVWLPAQISQGLLGVREARFLGGIGRLRPDVTMEQGAADLAAAQETLATQYPKSDAGWSATIRPLKASRIGDTSQALWLVFGAVALLWAIAIANVAGLALIQVQRRARELSIRTALGASRGRVVGLVMREGALVTLAGCLAGVGLTWWIGPVVRAMFSSLPRINELTLDWRALAFAAASCAVAVLLFGLVPALVATRRGFIRTIAAGGRGMAGGPHRLQKLIVVAQVALSVLLVGSAALLLRSYVNLTRVDSGFEASGTITFHVGARWDEDRIRIGRLQEQLVSRLEQLPYVRAAGFTNFLPATGGTLRYQVSVEGLAGPEANGTFTVGQRTISSGYLRTLQVSLLSGAWCPALRTDFNAPHSVLVNRRFVDVHANGQSVLGRQLRFGQIPGSAYTIAGVVADIAEDGPRSDAVPYVYACESAGSWPDPEYVVRTSDLQQLTADLRSLVHELDSGRAIFGLRPLADVLDAALDEPRMNAGILGSFAGAALMLAAMGLYGLFMLLVSERTREIAVRLALGATPRQVVGLVIAGAGRLLLAGLLAGVALTAAAGSLLRHILFGITPLDAAALLSAVLTLGVVSVLAIAGPALKASRIAPAQALRQ